MFRIGEFSKLSQVTVKALRYYDETGLLKPARIDPFTGYRYYSADQLPRLNRILVFKDLGLSLDQIARLLDDDLPTAEIRGMLRMKRADLQQELREQQQRLGRVGARLRQIEEEGEMPAYDVVIKRVDAQTVAAVRDTIPTYGDVGRLFGELGAFLGPSGARPSGLALAIYHDPEYRERDVDVEAAMPIAVPVASTGRVEVRELPAVEHMACTVHRGSYDTLGQAYTALMSWIQANGYRIVGPNREIYLGYGESGSPDPAANPTELQFPVEKA